MDDARRERHGKHLRSVVYVRQEKKGLIRVAAEILALHLS